MTTKSTQYLIKFHNQGKIYEIYAKKIIQSDLFGFIQIEDIVFDTRSSLVVDPSEEHLKSEFNGVKRTHIPMQAIIRIDEVEETGQSKITAPDGKSTNITNFPVFPPNNGNSSK
jgi:hypothetical protein